MMNIPILGIIENYSYFQCPDCGKTISIFGESHIDEIAKDFDLDVLAKLPINPEFAKAVTMVPLKDLTVVILNPLWINWKKKQNNNVTITSCYSIFYNRRYFIYCKTYTP